MQTTYNILAQNLIHIFCLMKCKFSKLFFVLLGHAKCSTFYQGHACGYFEFY